MELVTSILKNRGLSWDDYFALDDSTHAPLLDIDTAASVLEQYYNSQDLIVILPDFDMDGVMSGVVGMAGLSELGFNVALYEPIPGNGYGFHAFDINRILEQYPECKMILTCDVGITARDGIEYATSKGLDVFVTDHHTPTADTAVVEERATVVVNPTRLADTYAFKSICGAHVLWQVLDYYTRTKRSGDQDLVEAIWRLRLFAGLGTISDMMGLSHENRALVRDAVEIGRLQLGYLDGKVIDKSQEIKPIFYNDLKTRTKPYRRAFLGFTKLLYTYVKAEKSKLTTRYDLTSTFYGFYVAPMFNALKRLNGDMHIAFGLFFDEPKLQQGFIDQLFDKNEERKALVEYYVESEFLDDDGNMITSPTLEQPYAPYAYLSEAPGGIVGLLATKVIGETGLPVVVVSGNEDEGYHGSGRSPFWYNFKTRVTGFNKGFFVAGHEGAFGFGAKSLRHLKELSQLVSADAQQVFKEYVEEHGEITESVDLELSTFDTSRHILDSFELMQLMKALPSIEPFGRDWPEPVISITFRREDAAIRFMGADGDHVRFTFSDFDDFVAIAWFASNVVDSAPDDAIFELKGSLQWNYFNQTWSVNLIGSNLTVVD